MHLYTIFVIWLTIPLFIAGADPELKRSLDQSNNQETVQTDETHQDDDTTTPFMKCHIILPLLNKDWARTLRHKYWHEVRRDDVAHLFNTATRGDAEHIEKGTITGIHFFGYTANPDNHTDLKCHMLSGCPYSITPASDQKISQKPWKVLFETTLTALHDYNFKPVEEAVERHYRKGTRACILAVALEIQHKQVMLFPHKGFDDLFRSVTREQCIYLIQNQCARLDTKETLREQNTTIHNSLPDPIRTTLDEEIAEYNQSVKCQRETAHTQTQTRAKLDIEKLEQQELGFVKTILDNCSIL